MGSDGGGTIVRGGECQEMIVSTRMNAHVYKIRLVSKLKKEGAIQDGGEGGFTRKAVASWGFVGSEGGEGQGQRWLETQTWSTETGLASLHQQL